MAIAAAPKPNTLLQWQRHSMRSVHGTGAGGEHDGRHRASFRSGAKDTTVLFYVAKTVYAEECTAAHSKWRSYEHDPGEELTHVVTAISLAAGPSARSYSLPRLGPGPVSGSGGGDDVAAGWQGQRVSAC